MSTSDSAASRHDDEERAYQVTLVAWYVCNLAVLLAIHRRRRRPLL
jgi:hypothetical protein